MESQNRPKLDYLQRNQIYGTTFAAAVSASTYTVKRLRLMIVHGMSLPIMYLNETFHLASFTSESVMCTQCCFRMGPYSEHIFHTRYDGRHGQGSQT